MKTYTQKILLLLSFFFLIAVFCTSPHNPFYDTDSVGLIIKVLDKPDGYNYCINDKVRFDVTILLPHLVKAISVHYGENGDKEDKEITTNEKKNKKIFFEYEYQEKGLKNVKFTITFRESSEERDEIYNIDIGVKPTIRNNKNLLAGGDLILGKSLILSVDHDKFSKATYKWFKNTQILPGEDQKSLIFNPLKESDEGQYYCIVSTEWGKDQSKTFSLNFDTNSVITIPKIIIHPQSVQTTLGSSARFFIKAKGEQLAYQWQKYEKDLSGAQDTLYEVKDLKIDDNAIYRCIVSNSAGNDTSDNASLEVFEKETAPIIEKHPESQEVEVGDTVWFLVEAKGTNLKYQWYKDDEKIKNAILPTLETGPVSSEYNKKAFYCVVSNVEGEEASNKAILTVKSISKPEISEHPRDTSVTVGTPAMFTVEVNGKGLSYQWLENGDTIDQATEPSYIIEEVTFNDNGKTVSCIVSNDAGEVNSSEATLTVVEHIFKPEIVEQPKNQDVTAGKDARFLVVAKGGKLTYQWQENQKNILDANGSEYIHKSTKKDENGKKFRCIISNKAGEVTSEEAVLKVIETEIAPKITKQPENVTIREHEDATFSITVEGTNLEYQWSKNGEVLSGEDKSALKISSGERKDNGAEYMCKVKNSRGEVTSDAVVLVVFYKPEIVNQPKEITVREGQPAQFSIEIKEGNPKETGFQWLADGKRINNTSDKITITAVAMKDNGKKYSCIVSNTAGKVTSSTAILTVVKKVTRPEITGQPKNQEVTEGNDALFSVDAKGEGLKYQWQKDRVDISGATGSEYTYKSATKNDDGAVFRCIVSNSAGEVASEGATLKVNENVIAPKIAKQPENVTVKEGEEAEFSIEATGTNLVYQWFKNELQVDDAIQSTLKIKSVNKDDNENEYYCVVRNNAGEKKSITVSLTVLFPPSIKDGLDDVSVKEGAEARFKVVVKIGNPKKTKYQWYKGNTELINETEDELIFTARKDDNGKEYKCKVSNDAGEVMSNPAKLSVYYIEIDDNNLTNESVNVGESVTFGITAKGNPSVKYKWLKAGSSSTISTNNSLKISNIDKSHEGEYYCEVYNGMADSKTSKKVTLSVNLEKPEITEHPRFEQKAVEVGTKVTFKIKAKGTELKYQWRKNGKNIPKANSTEYSFSVSKDDAGARISCYVYNSAGSVESNDATITIKEEYTVTIKLSPQCTFVKNWKNIVRTVTAYNGGTAKFKFPDHGVSLESGIDFYKYNNAEYGQGDDYSMGSTEEITENTTFWAIFEDNRPKYKVTIKLALQCTFVKNWKDIVQTVTAFSDGIAKYKFPEHGVNLEPGIKFYKYNNAEYGQGDDYSIGSTEEITENTTFWAVFEDNRPKYTVTIKLALQCTFVKNWKDIVQTVTVSSDGTAKFKFPEHGVNLEPGITFYKYNNAEYGQGDDYSIGSIEEITENTTFWAIFEENR